MQHVVAFVGSKGGVGKSTLATHAAAWLGERGRRVVFVDADANASGARFLQEAAPGIRVERIPGADDLLEALPELLSASDAVVVDAPAGTDETSRAVLLRASTAILPTGPGAYDLRALARTARIVKQAQSIRAGAPRAVVVLNRVRAGTNLARDAAELVAGIGLPVAPVAITERVGLADCAGQGVLAWHYPPARESARELTNLFASLLDGHPTEEA